jgi:hypothetical protein
MIAKGRRRGRLASRFLTFSIIGLLFWLTADLQGAMEGPQDGGRRSCLGRRSDIGAAVAPSSDNTHEPFAPGEDSNHSGNGLRSAPPAPH